MRTGRMKGTGKEGGSKEGRKDVFYYDGGGRCTGSEILLTNIRTGDVVQPIP